MTIKSDKWIKKMAQEHQLIEPFTENQVRDADGGNKIISYGVSSFGYDVRCADEFKFSLTLIRQPWTQNPLMKIVLLM